MDYITDLDTPLLQLAPQSAFSLRDAVMGVQIFGGIGSGKTSGSGKALAAAYLRGGMGGLVLCAKPEEADLWLAYAHEHGRANSVVLFGDRGDACFNFINYEMARQGPDGIGSVIECIMRVLDAARLAKPNSGAQGEAFWEDTTRQLLRNILPILRASLGTIRIPDIIRMLSSAPSSAEQLKSDDWRNSSFMFRALGAAKDSPRVPMADDDYTKIDRYWREEYGELDSRLRSNISMTLSTGLDRFNRGRLQRAFCGGTNLVPEMCFHGAIIILDMSALTWNEDGIIAQQLFKFMWQRAVLARNALEPRHRDRPVFLWADESQYFVNAFDADFQSTCRSSRACTVYLTQSLPTYYAKMGGERAQHAANMLLSNFQTKIFHNNSCPETNQFAAQTIGRSLQMRGSYGENESYGTSQGMNSGSNTSWGTGHSSNLSSDGSGRYSSSSGGSTNSGGGESWGRNRGSSSTYGSSTSRNEVMDFEVEPGDFARYLATGGPANRGLVNAFWYQAGKYFPDTSRNYLYATFRQ